MEERFNFGKASPGAYRAMEAVGHYVHSSSLDEKLVNLVLLRASQLNGCAFCIDAHWKDLRAMGEGEQRLYGLDAWREAPYYSERERAALAWAEALTLIAATHVPDEVYEQARRQFDERELADLTLAVGVINSWNRIAIASRMVPGSHQPAQHQEERRAG